MKLIKHWQKEIIYSGKDVPELKGVKMIKVDSVWQPSIKERLYLLFYGQIWLNIRSDVGASVLTDISFKRPLKEQRND